MITVGDIVDARDRQQTFDFVISLVDHEDLIQQYLQPSVLAEKIHYQVFADCTYKVNFYTVPPSKKQIKSILKYYGENNLKEKNVLVHCHAGISRSTAVTIGLLLKYHELTIAEAYDTCSHIRKCMWPNPLIIKYLDEILDKKGELIAYDGQWKNNNRHAYY